MDERAEMAAISTTPLGVLRTFVGGLLVAAATLLVAGQFILRPVFSAPGMPDFEYAIRMAAPFVLAPIAILVARWIAAAAGRRSLGPALAWFKGLPFEIVDAERFLGEEPRKAFETRVRLKPGADLARLAAAVASLGKKRISARVLDGAVMVRFDVEVGGDDVPTAPSTNYRGLRFFRLVVDSVLRDAQIVSVEMMPE